MCPISVGQLFHILSMVLNKNEYCKTHIYVCVWRRTSGLPTKKKVPFSVCTHTPKKSVTAYTLIYLHACGAETIYSPRRKTIYYAGPFFFVVSHETDFLRETRRISVYYIANILRELQKRKCDFGLCV